MKCLTSEVNDPLAEMGRMTPPAPSLELLQDGIAHAIAKRLPQYNWTGFHLLDPMEPESLIPGLFVSGPIRHVRIPVPQSICGVVVVLAKP
jgi:GAF domain-containing protein